MVMKGDEIGKELTIEVRVICDQEGYFNNLKILLARSI